MGPRALGNRSILADPRDPQMQDRLAHIKRREPFRPLAPAELVEHAAEFFEIEQRTCRMRSLLPWAARISAPGAFPREADVFLYLAPPHWNAYPPGR
jgi:carbamoyltransferase